MTTAPATQADIRKVMRQRRARISRHEQVKASRQAMTKAWQSGLLLRRHSIICAYLSFQRELAPEVGFDTIWQRKRQLALPVLHPIDKNRMLFIRYKKNDPLKKNRFGIAEPKLRLNNIIKPRFSSLILCPLTAFDTEGNRIGMGGGFYDRTFAFKQTLAQSLPRLIGIAYDFQKVERLERAPWDVQLDGVLTDKMVYFPRKNKR